MGKGEAFFSVLLFMLVLFLSGMARLHSANRLQVELELGSRSATNDPFNRFPLLKFGLLHDLSRSFRLGGSLAYTDWSDYLGMFGGTYIFHCYRPAIELSHLFPALLEDIVNPIAGIGFGYNFYWIKNKMGNPYSGELKDHFFSAFFGGADLSFGKKVSGIARHLFITARIVWNALGDLSGVRGSLGLGVRLD
jgi:hypothetical protein